MDDMPIKMSVVKNCGYVCGKFKDLFSQPYLKFILLACFIDFGLISR